MKKGLGTFGYLIFVSLSLFLDGKDLPTRHALMHSAKDIDLSTTVNSLSQRWMLYLTSPHLLIVFLK